MNSKILCMWLSLFHKCIRLCKHHSSQHNLSKKIIINDLSITPEGTVMALLHPIGYHDFDFLAS